MVEFSEDFTTKLYDTPAVAKKVLYRLSVREGEIPYFPGGLDVKEFTYNNDLASSIRRVLSDFHAEVAVSGGRVSVGDIVVPIPEAY